jgi:4-hydroxybenzoate polyprenyltransferase
MSTGILKIADFIFAARPMLLLPVWSIYLISYNQVYHSVNFGISPILTIMSINLMVAGIYFINQIYDYESDLLNNKLGFLQKGLISRKEMSTAYLAVTIVALIIGFAERLSLGVIILTAITLGFFYSAPPMRFKDRPLAGLLANGIGYGFFLPLSIPGYMEGVTYLKVLLPLYFIFLVSAGYLLTLIPDREGDRKTGKNTLAIQYSDRRLIIIGSVLLFLSIPIAEKLGNFRLLMLSAVSLVLFLAALVIRKEKMILAACKLPILMLSLLAGYYFPTYLIFILVLIILTRIYYRKRFGMVYPRID